MVSSPLAAILGDFSLRDTDGVIRVGNTRVTLDAVISAFQEGATPEEIVSQYPSLTLDEVRAAISFYLQYQTEVDTYLQERYEEAEKVQKETELLFSPYGVRERLLARRGSGG